MAIRYLSGINVDSNTLFVDSTNNRVGIGTASPVSLLNLNNGDTWINVTDTLRGLQFGYAGPSHGSYRAAVMGGAESYGATDSGMLTFHTQNGYVVSAIPPERMRITSAGNVGIGTTAPAYKLDITGAMRATGTLYSDNGALAGAVNLGQVVSIGSSFGSFANLVFTMHNGGGFSDIMKLQGNGNVGIGTTSPAAKLEVYPGTITGSSTQEVLRIDVPGDNIFSSATGYINFRGYDVSNAVQRDAAWIGTELVPNLSSSNWFGGNLIFRTTATGNAQTPQERMRITSAGNVGIGTTSPAYKLSVIGDAYISSNLVVTGYVDATHYLQTYGIFYHRSDFYVLNKAANGWLTWVTRSTSEAETTVQLDYVRSINASNGGNVGIGTASPAVKFVVSNAGASGFEVDPSGGVGAGPVLQAYNRSTSAYMAQSYYALSHTFNVGSGGSTRAVDITSSGNVGIGTTSPNELLSVAGNIELTQGVNRYIYIGSATNYYYRLQSVGDDFQIQEVTTPRLTIKYPNGNVGIGTTSPASKLQSNTSSTYNSATPTGAIIASNLSSGNGIIDIGVDASYLGYIQSRNILNTTAYNLLLNPIGGNVGIGTTAPVGKLHIAATTGVASPGSIALSIRDAGSPTFGFDFNLEGVTTGDLSLMRTVSGVQSQVMTFDRANGNVGIGTTAPGYRLHVKDSANVGTIAIGNDTYPGLIYSSAVSGEFRIDNRTSAGAGYITFYPNGQAGTIGSEAMRITTAGNVGIGTTSPSSGSRLQVEGNIFSNNVGGNSFSINSAGANYGFILNNSANTFSLGYGPSLGTVGSSVLTWNSSGNVGIGTTSPNTKLQVRDGHIAAYYTVSTDGAQIYLGDANFDNASYWNSAPGIGAVFGPGTSVAGDLAFYVYTGTASSRTERMRITAAGNVGIGTTSPSYKLTVDGDSSEGAIGIERTTVSANAVIGALNFTNNNAGTVYGRVRGGRNSAGDGYVSLGTGLGDSLYAVESGNVGIGTTSPDAKLVIVGSGTGVAKIGDAGFGSGNYTGISLNGTLSTSNYNILSSPTDSTLYINRPTGATIQFRENNTTQVIIAASGNVGIGTTSPARKLTVYDASDVVNGQLRLGYSDDYYWELGRDGSVQGRLMFVNKQGGAVSELMSILPSGNVGIGTASPSQKLHVAGNARVTGAYYDSNNSAGSSGQVLSSTGSGTDWVSLSEITGVDGTGTANYVAKWSDTDTITNSQIVDNGTNVGINNASPKTKLDVNGAIGFGSKSMSMTDTFAAALTVNMNDHNGCYVKITAFGDWGNHSTIAYLGEFFLQASAGGYNEPGIIIRQVDNTGGGDDIQAQIVDPAGTGTRDFVIQLKATSSGFTPFTAVLQYEVRGQYNSVS